MNFLPECSVLALASYPQACHHPTAGYGRQPRQALTSLHR